MDTTPHTTTDRRTWIFGAGSLAIALTGARELVSPIPAHSQGDAAPPSLSTPATSFPSHDPELVRGVVGASHFDFDRVRELVEPRPELARAAWDWGFGDWESALGAASHTGRVEIAELLMRHGARANLFTLAMLGRVDAVRAIVQAQPGIQRVPGPHGITLLAHAVAGREAAASVVDYLETLGDADPVPDDLPLEDTVRDGLLGEYAGSGVTATVAIHRRGFLSLAVGDGPERGLLHQGELSFHPAGAPSVRIRFAGTGARPETLEIRQAEGALTLERTGPTSRSE